MADILKSEFTVIDQPGKMFKRTVKCFFSTVWKSAGRQLPHFQVIRDTLTADSLSGTGTVGTIAVFQIDFFFTFHFSPPGLYQILKWSTIVIFYRLKMGTGTGLCEDKTWPRKTYS